ncbi:hypothetical protein OG949_41530 (plasmid) [Streptomyces scopuliridis]|uniref:hypothetical protein n=1 Tax=Streptomyces scopuliridis TaxID=452529 RepID=UPI002DDB0D8B|nr:hypothetical protein [Streptomyces scopuliridis]WSB39231.1 hypothetical protein OG949_41530 [Streptomyces scopuliridis]
MPDAVDGPDGEEAGALLVEDHDGLLLLRTASDGTLTPADVADLARSMRADGTATIIVGAEGIEAAAFWPRLSELLDSLRESGTDTLRLVMAGAGYDTEDRPAIARRIADAWGMEVGAPDGPPLVVPGGSLFVPPPSRGAPSAGGWWRFAPGAKPEPLGPRSPEPFWQRALRAVPTDVAGGSVVEQIPAGLLIRPAEAAATQPGDLYHAVPVDPRRPAVVIGVPYGEDVSVEEVAEVLTALPQEVRSGVRLVPGGRRDVLPLAQQVSDLLHIDVEVMTGLPLVAAAGVMEAYSIRSVLAAPDGTPRWVPFVDAVLALPPDEDGHARPPRLLRWAPPLPGHPLPEEGVVGLSDRWQVTVTRAGLWVGPRGGPRLSPTARQVDVNGPVIELGTPGDPVDPSLWPALAGLLGALTPGLRERATLHMHGVTRDGGRELRRLAAQHGLRTLRFNASVPAAAGAMPTAQARPGQAGLSVPLAEGPSSASVAPSPPAHSVAPPTATAPAPAEGLRPLKAPVRRPDQPERPSAPRSDSPAAGASAAPTGPEPGPGTSPAGPKPPGHPQQAESSRPQQPESAGQSVQQGRLAPPSPVDSVKGARPDSPAERDRWPRDAVATGTAPATRASGARDEPAESAAAPGPQGRSPVFDWSDDSVPLGSLKRARRLRPVRRPDSAAGAAVPASAGHEPDERSGDERSGAPDRDDAGASRTTAVAGPGEGPAQARRPERRAGRGLQPGSAGTEAPVRDTTGLGPVDERSQPGESSRSETGLAHAPEGSGDPDTVASPAAAQGRAPVDGTGPADGASPAWDGGPAETGGPERADDSEQASVLVRGEGSATALGLVQAADEPGSRHGDVQTPGRFHGVPLRSAARVDGRAPADPASAVPTEGMASRNTTSGTPDSAGAVEVLRSSLPPVPFAPGHRSSASERAAFRALAEGEWDRHAAAVAHVVARMPGLSGKEQDAVRADLIALRMYLNISEGPLSHDAVTRALREGVPGMLPYGACVGSALNRLPSYRGAVLRGTGSESATAGARRPALPPPGALLRDAAPLSAAPFPSSRTATTPRESYVIWSVAGRRVQQLIGQGHGPEEVVFAPGTLFRVLDVRRDGSAAQIFLRELTSPAAAIGPDPEADRAVLARLDAVVRGRPVAPAGSGRWPDRCTGAVGAGP